MRSMTEWKKKLSDKARELEKLLGMLGLAMRAGKLVIGTEQVFLAMQRPLKPYLVLVSEGASEKARTRIGYKCEFYKIPVFELAVSTAAFGKRIGKTYSPACVGVMDEGFAKRMIELAESDGLNT